MNDLSRNPDRLNISQKTKAIVDELDRTKFMNLDSGSITRSELFLFAMSLGAETVPTKLEAINPGGFILEKSIDSTTLACIYALSISKHSGTDLDDITDKSEVYKLAQEYANTGFEIIENYLSAKKNSRDLVWELMREADEQYKTLHTVPCSMP